MSRPPPPLELPEHLRALIAKHGASRVASAEAFLQDSARTCAYFTSRRVSEQPLRRGLIGSLLRRKTASPQLSPMRSKFGGRPYVTASELPWGELTFFAQINLAEIGAPVAGLPASGILALDADEAEIGRFRVRWYSEPAEATAADPGPVRPFGDYETEIVFTPGWSLPEDESWDAAIPAGDDELSDAWDASRPGAPISECHSLGGYRSAGLVECAAFASPAGRTTRIEDYEQLLRFSFDNDAGFAWGTNWVYVIVHRDDLAEGRLDRAVVTIAGY